MRDFIKTTAVGAGAAALTGLGAKSAETQDKSLVENWGHEADVVVIGYGGSVYTRVYAVTGGNIGGCMASGRISGRNAAAET